MKRVRNEKQIVEIDIVNDGYFFINFIEKDVKQMNSVYYSKEDTWYIYQDRSDIKCFNGKDMILFREIINSGISTSEFLEIILNVGKKNYYRPIINKDLLKKYYPKGLALSKLFEYDVSITIFPEFDQYCRSEKLNNILDEK